MPWLDAGLRVAGTAVSISVMYLTMKYLMMPLYTDLMHAPDPKEVEAKRTARSSLARHFATQRRPLPDTNQYEERLIADLVFPEQIDTTLDDIGGLEQLKQEMYETVILPLRSPHILAAMQRPTLPASRVGRVGVGAPSNSASPLSSFSLLSAPRGVLLYGPPGCGKTMMAKAVAKQSGAAFLNLRMSSLQSKWYGESQKLIRAAFSLAEKMSPCILFIDEMDMLFRMRSSSDHEASAAMKGEFLQLWDGLLTRDRGGAAIMVLGATNRPYELDEAVLRRMPRQLQFELPAVDERRLILQLMLNDVRLDEDVSVDVIAEESEGYSGSDLKELCRYAVMQPVREQLQRQRAKDVAGFQRTTSSEQKAADEAAAEEEAKDSEAADGMRSVRQGDFMVALSVVQPTGRDSKRYLLAVQRKHADSMRMAGGG